MSEFAWPSIRKYVGGVSGHSECECNPLDSDIVVTDGGLDWA